MTPSNSTRIISDTPADRWQDSMVSGNGSTGIMVMGNPSEETIVVNHEKLWVQSAAKTRVVPDLADTTRNVTSQVLDGSREFSDLDETMQREFRRQNQERYEDLQNGERVESDWPHPGFHVHIDVPSLEAVGDYQRWMELESAETVTRWRTDCGEWDRRAFVSRPDDCFVLKFTPPDQSEINGSLRVAEAPGRSDGDVDSVRIDHRDDEVYFHSAYGRAGGREEPEGYHALGRVVARGGSTAAEDGRIDIAEADALLVLLRVEYLDRASTGDRAALRGTLADIDFDYDRLLETHSDIHREMLQRVRLDLGGSADRDYVAERILERTETHGPDAELLEALHAVGRYALVCSSGELPPALMGIWGDTWDPAWNGRYTLDSNLNLAVSAGNQGNLPEVMESFFGFIESLYPDWEENADRLYGADGYMSGIAHGWRHGKAMLGWYGWTGGAGWLSTYFWQHYLYTGDEQFLRERVVPLLKGVSAFYEDFLTDRENADGQYVVYPSLSPENAPSDVEDGQSDIVVPNATSEIAICRSVLRHLIHASHELDIEEESIPQWHGMLDKLPRYRINDDGALAEWSFPGVHDNYEHRHNSHLFGVYPGLEVDANSRPEMYEAARTAIEKRLAAGRGDRSAHGLMHMAFFTARLHDPDLLWRTMTHFATDRYLNRSLLSNHNPDREIYNLDATLSLPGVLMEMLVYSRPGMVTLLPALPAEEIPDGSIEGVLAHGEITIERLEWDLSTRSDADQPSGSVQAQLTSKTDQTVTVRLPETWSIRSFQADGTEARTSNTGPNCWTVSLQQAGTTDLDVTLRDHPGSE